MTDGERAAVAHVRKALEGVLSPSATSSVLFEALGQHDQPVPGTPEELMLLVRGPLSRALSKRLGEEQAQSVVEQIEATLPRDSFAPEEEIVIQRDTPPPPRKPKGRDADATRAVPTHSAPVAVAVIAAHSGFADRLRAALGPRRVTPTSVSDPRQLPDVAPTPAIVILDGSDFTTIEPRTIAQLIGRLPGMVTTVVWASDLPYGRSVLAPLEQAGLTVVPLTRGEGIDPLLDLIRSRRRALG